MVGLKGWANPYDKCYELGYKAWWLGQAIQDCPYAILSPEEGHWIRGWHKAGVDSRRRPKQQPKPLNDDPGFDLIED